ncbi:hypothetical protein RN001_009509 [Aquatica leii]|uniref:U6 snRNA phosphodiesterase n=1 Tax=Aquatica leii TaxID=1421715 RepID=A0AAN7SMY5_9COLE|nr:hypothetical protein RN001_009509 [Aquatica leii]
MNRGALDLLSGYGDDTSDDDVPNGRVSLKRCHSNEEINPKRLPVPELLNRVCMKDDTPIDDPSLHNGRVRSFPHERGNWATYVYVPYDPVDDTIIESVMDLLSSVSCLSFQPVNHFHISLTRTVVLKHHWIESFMKSVRERLSLIRKFVIVFDTLKVYCNEERTRTFIALRISSGYDTLIKIIDNLDQCLADFKLQSFYKDPSFHISLASCIGDHEDEIKTILPRLNETIQEKFMNNSQNSWITSASDDENTVKLSLNLGITENPCDNSSSKTVVYI